MKKWIADVLLLILGFLFVMLIISLDSVKKWWKRLIE